MQAEAGASARWDASMDELVSRASEGSRDAFAEIYRHLFEPVAKYIYYRIGERTEAEAMANEVFLTTWESMPNYRGGYFPGWVFRIARNQSVGYVRKLSKMRTVELGAVEDRAALGPTVEEQAETRIHHQKLFIAMKKLKEEQREIVIMKFILGMTNPEVAQYLNKTENAVNAQQHRALKSLKRHMEAEGL
ncbi:MAG: sigma-70 family RNA polymerase sigma factor [Actinomycetota bacterium]